MSRRAIGQEDLGIDSPRNGHRSSLDDLTNLIDWTPMLLSKHETL
jgi:hypothetical protein